MKNEIEIKYKLPRDWEKTEDISFVQLSDFITQLHDSAYTAAVKAVNRFATIRNYMIGFYIVEYEQHGSDRAKYGDKLLRRLAERVNKRGINETLLKVSRSFYLAYPQVKNYLQGKTPEKIGCPEKSATPSHQFEIPADKLISQLSFSHIREILTVADPLARFFYELECIKCCWSVKELRRQIATNLYCCAPKKVRKWSIMRLPAWTTSSSFLHTCFLCLIKRCWKTLLSKKQKDRVSSDTSVFVIANCSWRNCSNKFSCSST